MAYYSDMSESAALNFLAGTTDLGDAAAIRKIAAYIDAATGQGSPEGAVTGDVGDLYTDDQNGHLYIKGSGAGTNTGWVQLESATSGSGDVNGPGASTDNALVRFDGTGGKTVQNSGITVNDSGNVSSDLTVDKATPSVTLSGSGDASLNLQGAAGSYSTIRMRSGSTNRWGLARSNVAESGSNVGSDFQLNRFSDAGSLLGSALTIYRSSGLFSLGSVGATAGLELGTSGPRMMSGTGSPEGAVTAPVGSIWFQTDSTVGVSHWRKASGAGNTGWVVMEGDTGRRGLSAGLLNGWTGTLSVQRIGYMVTLLGVAMSGTGASSNTMYTLPTGFRPADEFAIIGRFAIGSNTTVMGTMRTTGNVDVTYTQATSATYFNLVFPTSDAWPSSLPGT